MHSKIEDQFAAIRAMYSNVEETPVDEVEGATMRTFICTAVTREVEEWCEKNCQSKFIITELAHAGYAPNSRTHLMTLEVVLFHADDCVLFQLSWASNETAIKQVDTATLADPVFTVEELEAENEVKFDDRG